MLPTSDSFDSVNCCCVLEQFGASYIVLGTYSGTLLFYRTFNTSENGNVDLISQEIQLEYTKQLKFPIVAVSSTRLNPTGSCTIVVNSTGGVHFFELSNEFLSEIILERLAFFDELQKLEQSDLAPCH